MGEKVMCVPADLAHEAIGSDKPKFHWGTYKFRRDLFEESNPEWLDRDNIEDDPDWKQIIPYVIFREFDFEKTEWPAILTYYRTQKAGEERLRGLASIGIGGHISEADVGLKTDDDPWLVYLRGMQREISEEIQLPAACKVLDIRWVGIVNENETDVGKVHLGMVHVITVEGASGALETDDELSGVQFNRLLDVRERAEKFENWSQLILTNGSPALLGWN
jgi:predicted NUDIX family phosphoesterase